MNKKIKYLTFIFLATTLFFFNIKFVSANTIKEITMDVYIDKNGNAKITEIWKANLTQGTEGYRPYSELENKEITNFTVKDETGRKYKFQSYWNTSGSFSDKAYKNGFNNTYNGVELCWGISKYGDKTYTLTYDISNFVTKYTDNQGIYFNFINFDQTIGDATITIHSDIPLSLDNARIWGFGNSGAINFENDKIVFKSNGTLSSYDYMVALVRFQTDLFETNNTSEKSFDDIYAEAMEDVSDEEFYADNDDFEPASFFSTFFTILFTTFFFPLIFFVTIIVIAFKSGRVKRNLNKLTFDKGARTLPLEADIEYYRDIPCNKNIFIAYWVASKYSISYKNELNKNIIGAALLKWIKEKKITVQETKKGLLNFKDNNYAIDFTNMIEPVDPTEKELYQMLKQAAGFNNILEAKEFEKWCKRYYYKLDNWFDSIELNIEKILEENGFITTEYKTIKGFFGKEKSVPIKKVNLAMKDEAIKLKGLKKFLLDFSTMPEREHFEVHIWEEYLIFAQVLGIADKVEEQFSKLYPDFKQLSNIDLDITNSIRFMVEDGYKASRSAKAAADARSSSYSGSSRSSGGGGSSFSSGGSSSGGSSGGGFR